jgi:HTH-type transcriptional regulator/antitoxin MqsA
MECPNCDNQELILQTTDIHYSYRGEYTLIKNVTGEFCPSCEEMVLEHEEAQRVSDTMAAFSE